ncbi:hypothetical protein M426DRAFT_28516 [Hypoxylon sp. CI-4A]|nr:hypothetical protein M426DRAFT_28516 [Hypoxylon sp. CI-4A]
MSYGCTYIDNKFIPTTTSSHTVIFIFIFIFDTAANSFAKKYDQHQSYLFVPIAFSSSESSAKMDNSLPESSANMDDLSMVSYPETDDELPPMRNATTLYGRRLLLDIKELVEKPYQNIIFHAYDESIEWACLILTPPNYKPLHLTVRFSPQYPIEPPIVKMDSSVIHPNVFGSYVCATILRRTEEHTPAYTLKGIAIQLLSFFSSDYIEQEGGGKERLSDYRSHDAAFLDGFQCKYCNFGHKDAAPPRPARPTPQEYDARVIKDPRQWPTLGETADAPQSLETYAEAASPVTQIKTTTTCEISKLPTELLLAIFDFLEFDELTNFAAAWSRISAIIRDFDVMRQRELQCFCLKEDYRSVNLGVGVSIKHDQVASEFDLLSQEAYHQWRIRQSVNNLSFQYWLPLPISYQHWRRVDQDSWDTLHEMKKSMRKITGPFEEAEVLFTFMNDVVVRLNQVADNNKNNPSGKSNLRHASEKAIDSYFHLFHLLVSHAADFPPLVEHTNSLLRNFMSGKRSKTDCPNLGHLLIALLISDIQITEDVRKAIIIEAITRNVVWLLARKGANMPELSFIEAEPVSAYRLDKTFQGSRTSYRLLMFSELFRRTARPSHEKTLAEVRDELFERHGAPPHNTTEELAKTVRRLHIINDFPAFLREMGLHDVPGPKKFSDMLRQTIHASMEKGYSAWGVSKDYAMLLRVKKDHSLWKNRRFWMTSEQVQWVEENWHKDTRRHFGSFFPNKSGKQAPAPRNVNVQWP